MAEPPPLIPTVYLLDYEGQTLDGAPTIKLGTTWHPATRKSGYATSFASPPRYVHLFYVDPAALPTPQDLYTLDGERFRAWLPAALRTAKHIERGGGTEWWWREGWDIVATVREYLMAQGLAPVKEENVDTYPIFPLTKTHKKLLRRENKARPAASLLDQFLATFFLAGRKMRRVQAELWDLWDAATSRPEPTKGIVQWATGVGKTVAISLFLFLSWKHHQGLEPFRAIILAPTKSILRLLVDAAKLLESDGLTVLEGFEDESLGTIRLPADKPYVLLTTHAAVVRHQDRMVGVFQTLDFLLYDEVHRITGEQLATFLTATLPSMTRLSAFLGTSATPFTSRTDQHRKIRDLFDGRILHSCDYATAIREGWIARPRVKLIMVPPADRMAVVARTLQERFAQRKQVGQVFGGKVILYFKDTAQIKAAYPALRAAWPTAELFTANAFPNLGLQDTSDTFCTAPPGTGVRILLACQKFREGSDIKGVDMTGLVGQKDIEPYILLQIIGRALRIETDPAKIGDCMVFRDKAEEEDTNPAQILYDVFANLILDMGGLGDGSGSGALRNRKAFEDAARLLGVEVEGLDLTNAGAVDVLQCLYERRAWASGELTLRDLQARVREYPDVKSPQTYETRRLALNAGWAVEPTSYPGWASWYEFLRAPLGTTTLPRPSLTQFKEIVLSRLPTPPTSRLSYEAAAADPANRLPAWSDLEMGYLTDRPSPMNLEADLFDTDRRRGR